MGRTDDILFGKLAVAHKIITPEQLSDCVASQAMAGEMTPLGQIMLERGIMKQDEIDLLLRLQREGLEQIDPATNLKRESLLFGRIVVEEGFATQEEVHICVRAQALDGEQGRTHRSLGDIMVEKGYLTTRQMHKILEKQKAAIAEAQATLSRPGTIPVARQAAKPVPAAPPPPAIAPEPTSPPDTSFDPIEPVPVEAALPLAPEPALEPVVDPIMEPLEEPPVIAEEPPPPPPPPPPRQPPSPTRIAQQSVRPGQTPAPRPAQPPRPATTSGPGRPPVRPATVASPRPAAKPAKKLQCPICDNAFQGAPDDSGWVKCPQCGTGFSPK